MAAEPGFDGVEQDLAVDGGQRFSQRDSLRTNFHAILRVIAVFDSTGPHKSFQAIGGVHGTGRVHVEETHLTDNRGSHEIRTFIDLGADLEAVAAGNAA